MATPVKPFENLTQDMNPVPTSKPSTPYSHTAMVDIHWSHHVSSMLPHSVRGSSRWPPCCHPPSFARSPAPGHGRRAEPGRPVLGFAGLLAVQGCLWFARWWLQGPAYSSQATVPTHAHPSALEVRLRWNTLTNDWHPTRSPTTSNLQATTPPAPRASRTPSSTLSHKGKNLQALGTRWKAVASHVHQIPKLTTWDIRKRQVIGRSLSPCAAK